jgi:hypothetical protein
MAELELTPIHKEILTALISIYHQNRRSVKGEDIARMINRNPGTVRNQMQALKMLGLVEGVPGPKGGYRATSRAYKALTIDIMEKETTVPIKKNGVVLKDVAVEEISFITPRHPRLCSGSIRVLGDVRVFQVGDKVEIGPTPVNKLVIRGEVTGRDDIENRFICSITEMVSLPKRPIIDCIESELVAIPAECSVREAAKILMENNLWYAPIMEDENVVGMASIKDITRAVISGEIDAGIKEFAQKEVISIDGFQPLREAVRLMEKYDIGSLLVTIDGKPRGHITRTKILSELVVY